MKVINFILVIVAMLMAITQSGFAEAAEVRSISRGEVRVISQLKRSGPWCSADLPEVCAKQKVKAAGKVCGTHFQKSLQQYNANRSVPEAEIVQQEQSEGVVESDIEIAAVAVPLSSESDTEDRGDDSERDSDLEKRYEEYIQSIDF